jgi:hypothetical protein
MHGRGNQRRINLARPRSEPRFRRGDRLACARVTVNRVPGMSNPYTEYASAVGAAVCSPEGSPMHRWNHDEKLDPPRQ